VAIEAPSLTPSPACCFKMSLVFCAESLPEQMKATSKMNVFIIKYLSGEMEFPVHLNLDYNSREKQVILCPEALALYPEIKNKYPAGYFIWSS
jgi:hypothetical protein